MTVQEQDLNEDGGTVTLSHEIPRLSECHKDTAEMQRKVTQSCC